MMTGGGGGGNSRNINDDIQGLITKGESHPEITPNNHLEVLDNEKLFSTSNAFQMKKFNNRINDDKIMSTQIFQ